MKVVRTLLVGFFVLCLAVFLVTTFIRTGLLREDTWITALQEGNTAKELETFAVGAVREQSGAEAAAKAQQNFGSDMIEAKVTGFVTDTLQFIRGARDEVSYTQPGTQLSGILSGVRLAYTILTVVWIGSGILALLTLIGVWFSSAPGRRLHIVSRTVVAGAILTLLGAAGVRALGAWVVNWAKAIPFQAGEEVAYFDASQTFHIIITSLVKPVALVGTLLAMAGVVLVVLARRRELPLSQTKSPRVKPARSARRYTKWLIVLGVIAFLLIASGFLFHDFITSSSQQPEVAQEDQTYTNEELGFSVWQPASWLVDVNSKSPGRDVRVLHKSKNAYVRFTALQDPGLSDQEYLEGSINARKEELENSLEVTVNDFQIQTEAGGGIWSADGVETVAGRTWRFGEVGQLAGNGRVFIVHMAAVEDQADEYLPQLLKIRESFQVF